MSIVDIYVFGILTLIAIADIKTMTIPWIYLLLLLPLVKMNIYILISYTIFLIIYPNIAKWIGGADINIAYLLWGIYNFEIMIKIFWLASILALIIEQKKMKQKKPIAFLVYIYFSFCILLLKR